MATHIALLRGINVGGRNKVSMADLRAVVAGLGHTDVATYIQSGNVLFTSGEADTEALAAGLEEAIESNLGVKPAVVVLSRADLRRAVRDNPYPDEPNPKMVHAVFFRGPVPEQAAEAIEAGQRRAAERGSGNDTAQVAGSTLYLHTPDGFGRSELALFLLGGPPARSPPGPPATGPRSPSCSPSATLDLLLVITAPRGGPASHHLTSAVANVLNPLSAGGNIFSVAGQHPYARRRL